MTTITVVRGDKLYDLGFTLQDSTGAAIDLTSGTITLAVQSPSSTTLKFTGTLSIVSATTGRCKYTVQATDFDVVGSYNAQIHVSYTSGTKVITFNNITIVVQPNLPK